MLKSETEQRLRLKERVLTFEEFLRYRLGTSAVRVVLALNESAPSGKRMLRRTARLTS